MNYDVTKNKRHNDEYDLDGRPINTMGYCIDVEENIVDREGGLVFKRELLLETKGHGMDDEIPPVFRRHDRLNNYQFNKVRQSAVKHQRGAIDTRKNKKGVSDATPTEMDRTAYTGFNSGDDQSQMPTGMNRRPDTVTPEVTMNLTQTKSSLDQRTNNIFSDPGAKQVNIHTGDDMNRVSDFNEPTVEVIQSKDKGRKSKQSRPKTSNNRGRANS